MLFAHLSSQVFILLFDLMMAVWLAGWVGLIEELARSHNATHHASAAGRDEKEEEEAAET